MYYYYITIDVCVCDRLGHKKSLKIWKILLNRQGFVCFPINCVGLMGKYWCRSLSAVWIGMVAARWCVWMAGTQGTTAAAARVHLVVVIVPG